MHLILLSTPLEFASSETIWCSSRSGCPARTRTICYRFELSLNKKGWYELKTHFCICLNYSLDKLPITCFLYCQSRLKSLLFCSNKWLLCPKTVVNCVSNTLIYNLYIFVNSIKLRLGIVASDSIRFVNMWFEPRDSKTTKLKIEI